MRPAKPDEWVLPLPRAFLRIGVTGHRIGTKFSLAAAAEAQKTIERVLADMARLARDTVMRERWAFSDSTPALSIVSSLAEGSDRVVAGAGLAAALALSVILPFPRAETLAAIQTSSQEAARSTA